MNILAGMTTQSRRHATLRSSSSLLASVNKMIADCVHKLELSAKRYSKDSVKLGVTNIECEVGAYALDVYFKPLVEGSHKSKDLTYVISINTFYEESLQFTLWTASYSNPRNVRTVKQMGDLDYSEYTAYDVYKVLFASDLNKKALLHPDSNGGFSKAFYTFYEKRLYPSLGGDDKLGKMLSSRHSFSRGCTTLCAGSDAGDYMAKAIMRAINKYGDIKICAFNNSTYSFNYPYVAYTFGDGQNPVFEVITSVRVVRGALFLYAVGGHAEDPMSRYKELFKMELGHAGWVDGEDIADALMAWAEDKRLWEGNKIGLDFRHMRREVEGEGNYYLEDNVDTQYLK